MSLRRAVAHKDWEARWGSLSTEACGNLFDSASGRFGSNPDGRSGWKRTRTGWARGSHSPSVPHLAKRSCNPYLGQIADNRFL